MKITTVLMGLAAMAATMSAGKITFGGGGSLGTSQTFGTGGSTVVATGYLSNGLTGNLFGKGTVGGTGSEDGLGLTADPSGCPSSCQHEIFVGTDFIQLDISKLIGAIQISMGSTGGGDSWAVYGNNTGGTLVGKSSVLASGQSDDGVEVTVSGAKSFTYLDIVSTKNNVLLQDLVFSGASTPTPEPATFGIVGLGGILIGLLRRKVGQK